MNWILIFLISLTTTLCQTDINVNADGGSGGNGGTGGNGDPNSNGGNGGKGGTGGKGGNGGEAVVNWGSQIKPSK